MGRIRITGLLLVLVLLLAGCGGEQAHTQQLFAMDTIMNLTAYGGKGEQALSAASEKDGKNGCLLPMRAARSMPSTTPAGSGYRCPRIPTT